MNDDRRPLLIPLLMCEFTMMMGGRMEILPSRQEEDPWPACRSRRRQKTINPPTQPRNR